MEIVESVEETGFGETYDLHVPGYNNYFLGDGPLVHNCGKSYSAMILAHEMGGFKADDFIMPYHDIPYFINKISHGEDQNIIVDELGTIFPYKQSMKTEVVNAFTAVEVARQNRNCLICCCRDITRIMNNFRNGKAQIVIQLLDRFPEEKLVVGVVLTGNPIFETEDKFGLSKIIPSYDFDFLRKQFENLQSFTGYIFFEDIHNYGVKDAQIKAYKEMKQQGIEAVAEQNIENIKFKNMKRELVKDKARKLSGQKTLDGDMEELNQIREEIGLNP